MLYARYPAPVVEASAGQLEPLRSTGNSIIIVAFNSAVTIGACLHSVLISLNQGDEIVVVDNASEDNTVDIIRQFLPLTERLRLIMNSENYGFARGCNIGIMQSVGEMIVLLNPDTTVSPRWIEKLRRAFTPDVGAVGPVSDHASSMQSITPVRRRRQKGC